MPVAASAGRCTLAHRGHGSYYRVNANDNVQAEGPARFLAPNVPAASSFQVKSGAEAIREIEIEPLYGPLRFGAKGDWAEALIWIYLVEEAGMRQSD